MSIQTKKDLVIIAVSGVLLVVFWLLRGGSF